MGTVPSLSRTTSEDIASHTRIVTVGSSVGEHARPASQIAAAADRSVDVAGEDESVVDEIAAMVGKDLDA